MNMKLETNSKRKLGLKGPLKIQFRNTATNKALCNSLSEFTTLAWDVSARESWSCILRHWDQSAAL